MFDLSGKTALVTGSTKGIGLELAKLLSKQGAKVFVHGGTSIEASEKISAEIPNSTPLMYDLIKSDCADKLYEMTGGVDILVVCASIQIKKNWDEYTDEELENQFNCNVINSYRIIKKYAQYMKKQKYGRIVTVGSVNQCNNHPMLAIYGTTKCAQAKLVKNIAPDLAKYGVTINNVAPGAVLTPRNEKALADQEFKQKVIDSIPLGYIATPQDITPTILLLCSDEGKYITGSDIVIDGGMSL